MGFRLPELLLGVSVAAACAAPGPTWSDDVAPIAQRSCTRCHVAAGPAPFSLDTYADASKGKFFSAEARARSLMPPWLPGPACRSLLGEDRHLVTTQDAAVLDQWTRNGMPEGRPGVEARPRLTVSELSRVDESLSITYDLSGHSFHAAHDIRCYKRAIPPRFDRHLVGFNVRPNSWKRVAAVGLYRLPASKASGLASEFECELQPGPTPLETAPFADAALLGVWQAANGPVELPVGTGARLTSADVLILRFFYHPTRDTGVEDTKIEFAYAQSPVSTLKPLSILDTEFLIPANTESYTHSMNFAAPRSGRLYGLSPHLRIRGRKLSVSVAGECAIDVPHFANMWQSAYFFTEGPVAVRAGDPVSISCTFSNGTSGYDVAPGVGPVNEVCASTLFWVDGE